MSLDVHLIVEGHKSKVKHSGIFIREEGRMQEISEEEWKAKHPEREPMRVKKSLRNPEEVYWGNITHNLGQMAALSGLYEVLWHPEKKKFKTAKQLIPLLEKGLAYLKEKPGYFRKYNDLNGWGTYDQFLPFVEEYLEACKQWPEAKIEVSV